MQSMQRIGREHSGCAEYSRHRRRQPCSLQPGASAQTQHEWASEGAHNAAAQLFYERVATEQFLLHRARRVPHHRRRQLAVQPAFVLVHFELAGLDRLPPGCSTMAAQHGGSKDSMVLMPAEIP